MAVNRAVSSHLVVKDRAAGGHPSRRLNPLGCQVEELQNASTPQRGPSSGAGRSGQVLPGKRRLMSQEAEEDVGSSPSRWAKVDGRQNRLRDVVGVSVILGTAILAESSSLIGWAGAYRTANFSLGGPAIGNLSATPGTLAASFQLIRVGGSFVVRGRLAGPVILDCATPP